MRPAHDSVLRGRLRRIIYGVARIFPLRPTNSAQAASLCGALAGHGIGSTMGRLSKAGDDPAEIVSEYQNASNFLRTSSITDRFYLSVKPPALLFDPDHAEAIVATAFQNGHSVHFDAHGFAHADETLAMLDQVIGRRPGKRSTWSYGLTLPSRWKRSAADARWVAARGVRPRLVKGDFRGEPRDEVEPAAGLLALVDQLAGQVPLLALASHDAQLARAVAERCRKKGTAVEFELFFGMPSSPVISLSRELKIPLRFYVPYGDTLIVYLVRDLVANPHKVLRAKSYQVLGSLEAKLARIIAAV